MTNTRTIRCAFTVVELLIAITVLLLISVGLSVIFGGIGDAVSDGRRNSELNRAAARIESQIRADLDRMTREGILVIANRYATDANGQVLGLPGSADPDGIRLSLRDTDGRPRRADEFMFFARGDFKSVRQPLVSGVTADAGEASIYYGIGQKRRPFPEVSQGGLNNFLRTPFLNPMPQDANIDAFALLGVPDDARGANPNRFARDWSLLRQVTLLVNPQPQRVTPPEIFGVDRWNSGSGINYLHMDSLRQVGLQPTARTIFNSIGWTNPRAALGRPGELRPGEINRWWIGDWANFPGANGNLTFTFRPFYRSSGVVDIAQGSIAEVRRQVMALSGKGLQPASGWYRNWQYATRPNYQAFAGRGDADNFATGWSGQAAPGGWPTHTNASDLNIAVGSPIGGIFVRAWALDMMPSIWDTSDLNAPRHIAGVRYEDLPPRLIYDSELFDPTDDREQLARAIAEANQEMLGAQVFVPRCSEFIVEWSYGFVDRNANITDPDFKQMRWYGLPRATTDLTGDSRVDIQDHQRNGTTVLRYRPRAQPARPPGAPADPERVHVAMDPFLINDAFTPEFAVFGLNDPKGTGAADDQEVTRWPKFIRVTMSLADPTDETLERTYQFVFAVPNDPA